MSLSFQGQGKESKPLQEGIPFVRNVRETLESFFYNVLLGKHLECYL